MDGTSAATREVSRFASCIVCAPETPPAQMAGIRLLMRDGSRLVVDLADPWSQTAQLARLLEPAGERAEPVTLLLGDGSNLMISPAQVLALQLPAEEKRPRIGAPDPIASSAAQGNSEVYRIGPYSILRVRDFLPAHVVEGLYRYTLSKSQDFQRSSTTTNDPEYRKSAVLYWFSEYQAMFGNALRYALPQICGSLGYPVFDLVDIECQLTATSNQEYFKLHNDNAAGLSHRRLTFIYYFHRLPRPFCGGDLRLFDRDPIAAASDGVRHVLELAPEHNSFVIFDSSCFHEVCSVTCEQPAFENSRFTVNGWLCDAKATQ